VEGESIFREAAVERLSTPDRLDQGLSIVGRATWVILLALGTLVIGGLAWSAILSVPITVRGQGMLLAPGGVLDVTSESPGRVISFTINIGDHVKAGDLVARLDQPDVRLELANAESENADAQEERRQIAEHQLRRAPVLTASIAQRLKSFKEQMVFLDQRLVWLAEKAKADEELSARNLTTRQKLLETKLEIGRAQEERAQAQNGIRNLDVEVSKAQIDDQRELLNVNLKIAAAERKIRTLRDKLERQSTVTSPYDGIVVELKVNPGEIVDRNGPLFSLIPSEGTTAHADGEKTGPLYGVIYIPPGDGKKVRPGMHVRVSPSTVRREEFGFIQGRIRAVAEVPSTVEGMNRTLKNRQLVQTLAKEGAPYEVVVDLLADPATPTGYRWSSSHGPSVSINGGTLASADVEVRSMPVLSLVIPPLRPFLGGRT
jgi:HlyD family secretion protein